jgi:hypothetical protein
MAGDDVRLKDETLHIEIDGVDHGASVDLLMHDHREPWMLADYDAFAVMLRFDDSSMDLKYVTAIDARTGMLLLADRWDRLAAALRARAARELP